MSYIGAQPTTAAFVTDTFSANGSGTVFTLSVAPANTNSILVAVSGVLQDPSTYSVSGTTLTFSAAPPAGTGNISVRFLGIPASGVTTTAYRTVTEFTATAGQTTFTPPSYTPGYINVYRNGALLGTADYTASNGTTVVLANPASLNDLVVVESFYVSSVLNAIPATAGAVTNSYLLDGSITKAKMGSGSTWAPAGTVVQVVQAIIATPVITTSTSYVTTNLAVSITPTSATSKILVTTTGCFRKNNANVLGTSVAIFRNSTNVYTGVANQFYMTVSSGEPSGVVTLNYLDSPATTSAISYSLRFQSLTASTTSVFLPDSETGTIIAMEIAA